MRNHYLEFAADKWAEALAWLTVGPVTPICYELANDCMEQAMYRAGLPFTEPVTIGDDFLRP